MLPRPYMSADLYDFCHLFLYSIDANGSHNFDDNSISIDHQSGNSPTTATSLNDPEVRRLVFHALTLFAFHRGTTDTDVSNEVESATQERVCC